MPGRDWPTPVVVPQRRQVHGRLPLEERLPKGRRYWPRQAAPMARQDWPPIDMGQALSLCEVVASKVLRRWASDLGDARPQIHRAAMSCDADMHLPVVGLTRPVVAWMLQAMYWRGLSHPKSLTTPRLHPPTGVHRWVTQGPQRRLGSRAAMCDALMQSMRAYRRRAEVVSTLLLKWEVRRGRLRLRPDLLADAHWRFAECSQNYCDLLPTIKTLRRPSCAD